MIELKIKCDKCGAEISTNTPVIFVGKGLEVKTSIPSKELLLSFKVPQNQPVFLEQILEHKVHLCSTCKVKFEEWLKEKE